MFVKKTFPEENTNKCFIEQMFAPAGAGTKKEYNIFIFYNIFLGKVLLLRVRVLSVN